MIPSFGGLYISIASDFYHSYVGLEASTREEQLDIEASLTRRLQSDHVHASTDSKQLTNPNWPGRWHLNVDALRVSGFRIEGNVASFEVRYEMDRAAGRIKSSVPVSLNLESQLAVDTDAKNGPKSFRPVQLAQWAEGFELLSMSDLFPGGIKGD